MAASANVSLWSLIWESSHKPSKILATTKHYKKTFLMKQLLSSTNSRFRTQTLKSSPTSCCCCYHRHIIIIIIIIIIINLNNRFWNHVEIEILMNHRWNNFPCNLILLQSYFMASRFTESASELWCNFETTIWKPKKIRKKLFKAPTLKFTAKFFKKS